MNDFRIDAETTALIDEHERRVMMGNNTYDAIVIGAGHNGMALSTYLGKSGWRVLVLERR